MIFVQEKYKRKMFRVEGSIERKSIFIFRMLRNILRKYYVHRVFLSPQIPTTGSGHIDSVRDSFET